jgi:ornithine cyclodeaminase/alanine dehydrogenase-like protein (mu-crystallin family)
MLILSEADVQNVLTPAAALAANERSFYEAARGNVLCPPRVALAYGGDGVTLFKPALVPGIVEDDHDTSGGDADALGLKVVSVRPLNAQRSSPLPTVPAVVMLMHADTGLPACLMGATYLTAVRTAAGSALATRLFAAEDAATLTVFGAGMQASAHVHACSM